MTPEELRKIREELGLIAIRRELARIVRLIERAKRPSRTPDDDYDDLRAEIDDDFNEFDEEEE